MANVYLASRYSRIDELNGYKKQLEDRKHKVPARWLLGEHQVHGLEASKAIENDGPIPLDIAVKFAEDDFEDILHCDAMINFTEVPRTGATRGGRHVECGIILGIKAALGHAGGAQKLFIVGPLENVFHSLPDIDGRFNDFNGFLAALDNKTITF